jgi:serine/threonine protein kinase
LPDLNLEACLEALPEAVRREARERIEAGLRVRSLRSPAESPPADWDTAPRLPGYRIDRQLGQGSLGVVYAAHDEKLNRNVALKVLRPRADAEIRRRVLDEARKAAALSDPAIVTIFSVLDETDPPAIVMELVEGFPLDRFAAQLSFEQKARLLREVARALATAHEHGLIHRDLKPENIIVGPDLRPRILTLAWRSHWRRPDGRAADSRALHSMPHPSRSADNPCRRRPMFSPWGA